MKVWTNVRRLRTDVCHREVAFLSFTMTALAASSLSNNRLSDTPRGVRITANYTASVLFWRAWTLMVAVPGICSPHDLEMFQIML